MSKTIRIGAATAFFNDSRMGIAQLLEKGGELDYIIFDFLAESVMGGLGRGLVTGMGRGFASDFAPDYIIPHLQSLLDRGIKVVANAGGLNPAACAEDLRQRAEALGLQPRIGIVEGDNLTERVAEIVGHELCDMFDGFAVRGAIEGADLVNSLVAYTGASPIAAALTAGADIVVTGRAVDSAMALGPLIHEFGWGPDQFDLLAAGTLAGHLLECSAQVTGGTFTDWRDVPGWADIGMPIGECSADGSLVITKPEGTGGLVSVGTVAEQLLYEVSDPQRYYVADVVCDFSQVRCEQIGQDRVRVSGARGLGRTSSYKASLTYERGWRAAALIPVIGLEASAKARRLGEELFTRTNMLLRRNQMPPLTRSHCEVIGGDGEGPTTALCRLAADHPDQAGAQLLVREQSSAISHMSVGISMSLAASARPIQRIASFLVPKSLVAQRVWLDGQPVAFTVPSDARGDEANAPAPAFPPLPDDIDPRHTVPLIRLAWGRSGDKGNLFNVAVIAREAEFLPYIAAALTPEALGSHYQRVLGLDAVPEVERFSAPGLAALNFVVRNAMDGGILASLSIDSVAKGRAQMLLDYPIPVSAALLARL